MRATEELTVEGSDGGVFAVSYTPLSDPRGETVGGMIVLYDVTEERQRKQQLAVFNRVLRHNLRNEMTVIRGHAELLAAEADDPQHRRQASSVVGSSQRLLSVATKANEFDRIRERDVNRTALDPGELLEGLAAELREDHPEAAIDIEPPTSDVRLRSDPELLAQILTNLIENAIVHAEGEPDVTVRSCMLSDGTEVAFEVRDTNRRIADLEIESLRAGTETPLQHASGVGLWIVTWCVTRLNGDIEFEYDGGNAVTVTLPSS
jgi:signal transduction histidine kinase